MRPENDIGKSGYIENDKENWSLGIDILSTNIWLNRAECFKVMSAIFVTKKNCHPFIWGVPSEAYSEIRIVLKFEYP